MTSVPSPNATKLRPAHLAAAAVPAVFGAYLLLTSTVRPALYGFADYWTYDAKRMLELLLLAGLFGWVALIPELRRAFAVQFARGPRWLKWALLAVFALGLVSAGINSTSRSAWLFSVADVLLVAVPVAALWCIAAARTVAPVAFDRIACSALLIVPLAIGTQELMGVLAVRGEGLVFGFYDALPGFHFPRFYNQMQSWMMPATVAAVLVFPGQRLVRGLVLAALALHWYVVLATGARGTMLGVTVATGLCIVLFPAVRARILRYQGLGLAVGAALFAIMASTAEPAGSGDPGPARPTIEQSGSHGDSYADALAGRRMLTSTGRIGLWRAALRQARAEPITGTGPGSFACTGWPTRMAHPHSFPLQILAEWGAPALVLILAVVLAVSASCAIGLRRAGPESSPGATASLVFGGVVAAAVHACVSGVLTMPASQMTGLLVGGWLLASMHGTAPGRPAAPSRAAPFALAAFVGIAAWFALAAHRDHDDREEAFGSRPGWQLAYPRFWHNGKVCESAAWAPAPENSARK